MSFTDDNQVLIYIPTPFCAILRCVPRYGAKKYSSSKLERSHVQEHSVNCEILCHIIRHIYERKYAAPDDRQYNTCTTHMRNIVIFFCDIYIYIFFLFGNFAYCIY